MYNFVTCIQFWRTLGSDLQRTQLLGTERLPGGGRCRHRQARVPAEATVSS